MFYRRVLTSPRLFSRCFVGWRNRQICKWNLLKFAEALAPALPLADSKAALEKYDGLFAGYYEDGMRRFVGVDSSFRSKSYIRTGLSRATSSLEVCWGAWQRCFTALYPLGGDPP